MSIDVEQATKQAPSQPLHTDRLIMATNRGPVEYYITQNKELKSRRGAGGVVTALVSAVKGMEVTWVAMAMTEGDRRALKEAEDGILKPPQQSKDQQLTLRYVAVPKSVYRKHYDLISNQVLWFLQHYMYGQDEANAMSEKVRDAWEHGYKQANQALAEAVCAEIEREETSTVVMLHDYHLYLVSNMIRQRCKQVVMQQFIHIPWPEVRYWQSFLPVNMRREIFRGLLGNNIVGFQTRRDADNFLQGVQELFEEATVDLETGLIEMEGHQTRIRDYPISISVEEERKMMRSTAGKRAIEQIRPLLREKTIVRVDRIEPTKNIVLGFHAYDYLLDKHPELQEKVNLLAFLTPSRESLPTYKQYKAEVLHIIDEVNQKYGRNGWQPVQAFVQNDRMQALAAMQFYDVLLVNPLIDGMNLVAKEGPVVNQRNGVLVLSRTSGAFQQLGESALAVTPGDLIETAEALYRGLTMPEEERRELATRAREEVERDNLQAWIAQQINDINDVLAR